MDTTRVMQAVVVEKPGSPEVLQLTELPVPQLKDGWVLIRVKAFGLNRSEMFTRQGHSPGVKFPRVLGIECVGVVEAAPGTDFTPGQTVAALMGGMGRDYDGGYAEYALVPAERVLAVQTGLPWEVLGSLPETFLTAWGSLFDALEIKPGQTLLIRGGTSALGLAAATLAQANKLRVLATTRNPTKAAVLEQNGVDEVIIDKGQIAPEVQHRFGLVDAVLELVGTSTLLDSLQTVKPKGIVCNSGILGNQWIFPNFEPMTAIPSTIKLTTYTSENTSRTLSTTPFQNIVDGVAVGRYRTNINKVFGFNEIVQAHQYMENNLATGKLVVLI